MVAERVADLEKKMQEVEAKLKLSDDKTKQLEDKLNETADKQEDQAAKNQKFGEDLKNLEDIKNDFGSKLQAKLATMEVEAEQKHGIFLNDLKAVISGAQSKFDEIESNIKVLYADAGAKFKEIEATIDKGQDNKDKKRGFLPDKLMIPKVFSDDVSNWRKWKDEVAKYFDEGKDGMKAIMDDVSRCKQAITKEVLEEACSRNPTAVVEQLQKWKHLYRALEKLTAGEAAKVISTVSDENGFEAWRQLHLRFEPELEAQKNVVLLELHSIPPATSIEETKAKLVELRCRIAKAEDILGDPIQQMQKMTALLQVIDPITKQHTATLKELDLLQILYCYHELHE